MTYCFPQEAVMKEPPPLRKDVCMNKKKPTYSDISRITGVSMATISRIINNSGSVKPETRQKVMGVMKSLGIDTSELSIIPRESNLIIFNVPSFDNPFYSTIIHGAKASAKRNSFTLLINEENIQDRNVDEFTALLKKSKATGLITTNQLAPHILEKLDRTVPVVQCCECIRDLDIPFVTINDVATAHMAMEHIIALGRKKIAFINGPIRYKYAQDRLKGYIQALEYAGIQKDQDMIIQLSEINFDMAVSAAIQILNSPKRPDAFFTSSDVYAAAVIKAAKRLGIQVPRDVVVVGFDNVEISSMCNPSITTVNQPRYQLGFLSCEILVKRINNDPTIVGSMYLETELIIRESSSISLNYQES